MAEPATYWPSGLPDVPLGNYTHALGNNTVRTSMEFGPPKARRRSSSAPSYRTVSYALSKEADVEGVAAPVDQKALFEQFYAVVGGFASFWLPDPENLDQYILVRIVGASDDKAVEFNRDAEKEYTITLSLEVHPLVPAKPRV